MLPIPDRHSEECSLEEARRNADEAEAPPRVLGPPAGQQLAHLVAVRGGHQAQPRVERDDAAAADGRVGPFGRGLEAGRACVPVTFACLL